MNDTLEYEMRVWLLLCSSDEYDDELINKLTRLQMIKIIEDEYNGGFVSFVRYSIWAENKQLNGWRVIT